MKLSLVLLPLLAIPGHAAHLRISGRPLGSTSPNLRRRASLSGTMSQLGDSHNLAYTTNITFNGRPFSVMIDTGSSDLWVSKPVPGAIPQNFQASVTYASGSASGDVLSATVEFAGFSIDSQFFINASDGTAAAGADGLIGLGPSSASNIRQGTNSSAANPPVDKIFTSNSSMPHHLAILLQRSDDPDDPYPGDLAIGDVLPDYKDILNQPRLPVTLAPLQGGQHWQTLLDINGIIGPDGKPIPVKTQVTGAHVENITAVIDSGFSLSQVHPDVAQALYGNIPNAALTNLSSLGEIWVIPCDQEVNATFLLGGAEFPIHPLDLNFDEFDLKADNGSSICVGAFQPYSFDIVEDNEILFDLILGMGFLRNAYMLINFGNLIDGASPSTDTAFIQLLSTTNSTQASQDFAKVRGGKGSIGKSGSSSSPFKFSTGLLIGVIAGVVVLILLIAGIARYCLRRRNSQNTFVPSTTWATNASSYRPIHEPSPQAAYDIHMPPARPGYYPQHVPEYQTAWDARF